MNSIGVDFKLKNIQLDNKSIKLQIWDTAGQERFRTITTSYYKGAQAIVIVYDVTDKDSFDHVKTWMLDIEKFAKENVLKFLVGNKCDLEHRRVVSSEQGKELARLYNIQFIETSAKDTININELFEKATKTFIDKQLLNGGNQSKKDSKSLKNSKNIEFENKNNEDGGSESKRAGSCCS